MAKWILSICTGYKIGAYLSDITGAFDRVDKRYMLGKLYTCGVSDTFLYFLDAYLEPRRGYVAMENVLSDEMVLENNAYTDKCHAVI